MDAFIFNNVATSTATLRADIPCGITDVDGLFKVLASTMKFPEYFGYNWDAFNECICDLCWLQPGDVFLIHQDLPLIRDEKNLRIYLSCLIDAVENWRHNGSNFISQYGSDDRKRLDKLKNRNFQVVFPPSAKADIVRIISDS